MSATRVERQNKKMSPMAKTVLLTSMVFFVIASMSGTYALWRANLNTEMLPFINSGASFIQNTDGNSSTPSKRPGEVTTAFPDTLRSILVSQQTAYALTTVSSTVGPNITTSYKINGVNATGVFADEQTNIKVMVVPTTQCDASSTGSVLYEGRLSSLTTSSRSLSPLSSSQSTSNEYLCSVVTAGAETTSHTQGVTVTGDTLDGEVSATDTYTYTVRGTTEQTGTLSLTSEWSWNR